MAYWKKRPPVQEMVEGYLRSRGMLKERKEISGDRMRQLCAPPRKPAPPK